MKKATLLAEKAMGAVSVLSRTSLTALRVRGRGVRCLASLNTAIVRLASFSEAMETVLIDGGGKLKAPRYVVKDGRLYVRGGASKKPHVRRALESLAGSGVTVMSAAAISCGEKRGVSDRKKGVSDRIYRFIFRRPATLSEIGSHLSRWDPSRYDKLRSRQVASALLTRMRNRGKVVNNDGLWIAVRS